MTAASARELITLVTDDGSMQTWDDELTSTDPLEFVDVRPYTDRLAAAAERSGTSEAVVTGEARIRGHRVVVVAGEFAFLAGSIGVATGERITRSFERAIRSGLPVLAMPVSGGTRMQEGTLAFVQMVKATTAVQRLRDRGLCYLVYLRHPTMGGVLASWASLGHLTFAAPGALVGFTGPRVIEMTTGHPFPAGVQVAENLLARGLIDDVVAEDHLADRVARVLSVVTAPPPSRADAAELPESTTDAGLTAGDAWTSVLRSREPGRPGARALLGSCATEVTFLRGDGLGGGDDAACLTALCRLGEVPAVVIAQDRDDRDARMGPAGFRKARRAMAVAAELDLPVVTVIDTPGAELSREAEESGLAAEIARCLAALSTLPVPTVAVLLGRGAGGGALALLPADRVVCAQHAWLSAIAPEGASAILHRTAERASELANAQAVASWDLQRFGIVDTVVAEQPPAHQDPVTFLQRVAATLATTLLGLAAEDDDARLAARARRYRRVGDGDRVIDRPRS